MNRREAIDFLGQTLTDRLLSYLHLAFEYVLVRMHVGDSPAPKLLGMLVRTVLHTTCLDTFVDIECRSV